MLVSLGADAVYNESVGTLRRCGAQSCVIRLQQLLLLLLLPGYYQLSVANRRKMFSYRCKRLSGTAP